MNLFVDPDIRKARTLSSDFYTDGRFFEMSKEKIFSKTWHFAGLSGGPENLKPLVLLPDFLDEPVLVTRTDGNVNCVSNVCTHRGKILIEEPCEANLIRCGYHGRRFDLEGKFLSMPEFADVCDFPTSADNLTKLSIDTVGDFLFVSIDPLEALASFTDNLTVLLDEGNADPLKLASSRDYEVDAHWALYCENYLEGFHIPFVHKSLNEIVDYGTYTTETFRFSSLQTAYDANGTVAGRYLFIFPNMMFNFYPWGISVNVVRPVSPSRSVVEFLTYVADESKLGSGAGGDLHRVELEDEAVVASVQRGLRSRFYSHGRYSPTREQGTHHFHRLIAEFMG